MLLSTPPRPLNGPAEMLSVENLQAAIHASPRSHLVADTPLWYDAVVLAVQTSQRGRTLDLGDRGEL